MIDLTFGSKNGFDSQSSDIKFERKSTVTITFRKDFSSP